MRSSLPFWRENQTGWWGILAVFLLQDFEFGLIIDLYSVVGLVAWPLNKSEAGVDIVLVESFLLFLC